MYYCLHTSLALLLALVTASSLSPLLPPLPPPTLEIRRSSASITLFFLLSCLSVFCPDSNFPPLKSGTRRHFFDTHAVPQTLHSLRNSSPLFRNLANGAYYPRYNNCTAAFTVYFTYSAVPSLFCLLLNWHTTALNASLSSRLFQNQSFPEIQISRHDRQLCSPAVNCV